MTERVRSKYSNMLKPWVIGLRASNGPGKTLRSNSGPCNVVLHVRGEFIKLRGNRCLVQPATVLLPTIQGKAYRLKNRGRAGLVSGRERTGERRRRFP
jgi:hypothetical protein